MVGSLECLMACDAGKTLATSSLVASDDPRRPVLPAVGGLECLIASDDGTTLATSSLVARDDPHGAVLRRPREGHVVGNP